MTTQVITLNLIPSGIKPVIHVSQYDKGQTWIFKLLTLQEAFLIPEGSTVELQGTNSDGTIFNKTCVYSGNTVTVDVTDEMTACAGKTSAEIRIKKGNDAIGTQNFSIQIEKKP